MLSRRARVAGLLAGLTLAGAGGLVAVSAHPVAAETGRGEGTTSSAAPAAPAASRAPSEPLVAPVSTVSALATAPGPAAARVALPGTVTARTFTTRAGQVVLVGPAGRSGKSDRARPLPVVVYHHGFGGSAAGSLDAANAPGEQALIVRLARAGNLVVVSDFGGSLWANSTDHRYMSQAVALARRKGGAAGPVSLVGVSMGAISSLSYAARWPGRVSSVTGILPGLDLNALRSYGSEIGRTYVDDAYGGRYRDRVHGAEHSPAWMVGPGRARTSPFKGMPISLWHADGDTLIPPAAVARFESGVKAGRGARISTRVLRGYGHDQRAVSAVKRGEVVRFVRAHRSR